MMIMVSSFFNKNKYDGANIEKSLVFALAIIELSSICAIACSYTKSSSWSENGMVLCSLLLRIK